MNNELIQVVRVLKAFFWMPIAISVLLMVLYESSVLLPGGLEMDDNSQFMLLSVMELLFLAAIPSALYLLRMKGIRKALASRPAESLQRYGILRLLILGAGLVANTLLYYMSMNISYGFMAIILLIAMAFVYPSRKRCLVETSPTATEGNDANTTAEGGE